MFHFPLEVRQQTAEDELAIRRGIVQVLTETPNISVIPTYCQVCMSSSEKTLQN